MTLFFVLNRSIETPYNWIGVLCDSSNTVIRGFNLRYKGFLGALSLVIYQIYESYRFRVHKSLNRK